MRGFLLLLLFLGGSSLAAFGQEQERKLADRVLKPDYTLSYDLHKSSFGSKTKSYDAKKAKVKDYAIDQRYATKSFDSKPFSSKKFAWFGHSKYETSAASIKGPGEIPKMDQHAETRAYAVNESREARKTVDVQNSTYAHRTFFGRGRSQDRFDQEKGVPTGRASTTPVGYGGDLKTLTIDDIRSLLNKNK